MSNLTKYGKAFVGLRSALSRQPFDGAARLALCDWYREFGYEYNAQANEYMMEHRKMPKLDSSTLTYFWVRSEDTRRLYLPASIADWFGPEYQHVGWSIKFESLLGAEEALALALKLKADLSQHVYSWRFNSWRFKAFEDLADLHISTFSDVLITSTEPHFDFFHDYINGANS